MSVSKQDWKQWYDKHWDSCNRLTVAVTQAFEETITAVSSGDADRFLSLTGGETDDGLHKTTNAAEHALSEALEAVQDLNLKGNQRRFANQEAIDASDGAIQATSSLLMVVSQVDTELVRGVQPEREAVQADASAITGIASNLNDRLNSTLYMVKGALSSADSAAQRLAGISKIGRF